jgi:hypothetical protein
MIVERRLECIVLYPLHTLLSHPMAPLAPFDVYKCKTSTLPQRRSHTLGPSPTMASIHSSTVSGALCCMRRPV